MSTLNTTHGGRAVSGEAIAGDRARALLGQVMGYVAVTVAFAALGSFLGRDLSGGLGLLLLIAAIPVVVAALRSRQGP